MKGACQNSNPPSQEKLVHSSEVKYIQAKGKPSHRYGCDSFFLTELIDF